MKDIVSAVLRFINETHLISKGSKVLLAVSGGADSVAMFEIFKRIAPELHLDLAVAHIEHGIRGEESVKDAKFVSQLAESNGIPFYISKVNAPEYARKVAMSLEESARELRYSELQRIADENSFDLILTAHTLSDLVETVLFNLFRGSGIRGLAGIPVKRGKFVRPMMCVWREDVENFLKSIGANWRIDSTNYDLKYSRNFIRRKVIPLITSKFPYAPSKIADLSKIARIENDFILTEVEKFLEENLKQEFDLPVLNLSRFSDTHQALKFRIISEIVRKNFGRTLPISAVESVLDKLSESVSGNAVIYSDKFVRITCEYDNLVFAPSTPVVVSADVSKVYAPDLNSIVSDSLKGTVYIKSDVKPEVRKWKAGDRIKFKFGIKKVKDWFIDKKVPLRVRERSLIVEVKEESAGIIVPCGYPSVVSEPFRVEPEQECWRLKLIIT